MCVTVPGLFVGADGKPLEILTSVSANSPPGLDRSSGRSSLDTCKEGGDTRARPVRPRNLWRHQLPECAPCGIQWGRPSGASRLHPPGGGEYCLSGREVQGPQAATFLRALIFGFS